MAYCKLPVPGWKGKTPAPGDVKTKGTTLELDNEGELTGAQDARLFEQNFPYDVKGWD